MAITASLAFFPLVCPSDCQINSMCNRPLIGTHVIWGLNLGQNNITAAFLNAASLHAAFASDQVKNAGITLDFVEIGNEPDLFGNNGARNSSAWNIGEYVKE